MKLAPAIGQIFEEYRDIVIRPLVRIAARTGPEQHDAFDPIAVELIEGSAKAPQDLIIGSGIGHCAGSAVSNPLEGSHSATRIEDPVALAYEAVNEDDMLTPFAQPMRGGTTESLRDLVGKRVLAGLSWW
jgi:hypothetical protein